MRGIEQSAATAAALTVACLLSANFATLALAQEQDAAQQKCLAGVSKAALKVVKTQARENTGCVKAAAGGEPGNDACLLADAKGKVAKARTKATDKDAQLCGTPPDFGYAGAVLFNATAVAESRNVALETFFSIDAVENSPLPKCQDKVVGSIGKLVDTRLKSFLVCARKGLKATTLIDVAGLEACLVATDSSTDKRVAKAEAKIGQLVNKKCSLDSLATNFLGLVVRCGGLDTADSVGDCAAGLAACRACQVARNGNDLGIDCDLFDDTLANGSCPDTCGNGVVAGTEGCDDANFTSGDGCDTNCTVTMCGNGLATAGEQCDQVSGLCIGGPLDGADCANNAQCEGGVCTSCPSTGVGDNCAGDCTCHPAICCDVDCSYYPGFGSLCFSLGGSHVPCDSCQKVGDCCSFDGQCVEAPVNPLECTDLGGVIVGCNDCVVGRTCCDFGGYCAIASEEVCTEYEGTVTDCSLCSQWQN